VVGTPYYVDRGEVTGYDYIGVVEGAGDNRLGTSDVF